MNRADLGPTDQRVAVQIYYVDPLCHKQQARTLYVPQKQILVVTISVVLKIVFLLEYI